MSTISIQKFIELIEVVCEQDALAEINVSEADVQTSFDELGLDSLALLSLVAQLEQELSVTIGLEAATTATTPQELFDLVHNRMADIDKVA